MKLVFLIVFGLALRYNFAESRTDQGRIVGGQTATKSYPYQVSLEEPQGVIEILQIVSSWSHYCGGSIITVQHVLTAAHCLKKKRASVLAGTNNIRNGGSDFGSGIRYQILSNLSHPGWLTDSQENYDIGIVTIVGAFTFVPNKIEAAKFTADLIGPDVLCVATGWGSMGEFKKGPYPGELQEVYETTVPSTMDSHCADPKTLCAFNSTGHGICDGDSGGPLFDVKGQRLVGVSQSILHGCATGSPDVFTRISYYYDWIVNNTKIINTPPNGYNPASVVSDINTPAPPNGFNPASVISDINTPAPPNGFNPASVISDINTPAPPNGYNPASVISDINTPAPPNGYNPASVVSDLASNLPGTEN